MQFTYTPEGADPRSWPFQPEKLMNAEAEAIERVSRMTFAQWEVQVTNGSMTATHALLWVLLKRDRPTLKYDEVVFSSSEVALTFDDEESARMLADLEAKAQTEGLEDGEAAVLELLRAAAPAVEEPGPDDEPSEPADPHAPPQGSDPKED